MIFRIFCIAIIFMGAGAFGKTKIALIGDSVKTKQVADLVLAKMADNNDLEFLERSAIEKVMKEHKLQGSGLSSKQIPVIAKILHADIFAVLSSAQVNKKTIPSSLRVFDARNGFCLIDTALPAEIEKCTDFVSSKLKTLPSPRSLKFVSILAVRNAGAPTKYKRQMAHIAIEIERRLIAMPDVAVLERSELGLVNKERKITKKMFKLAPAAYLLDLEFAPGSSGDKIYLSIYILNIFGKELQVIVFGDCLKTEVQHISKVLAKYLKTRPSTQIADAKQEARRFFKEYKYGPKLDRYDIAENNLETAIALDPDNPDYLFELSEFIQTKARYLSEQKNDEKDFAKMLITAKRAMKMCDEIKERFPKYRKKLYSLSILHAMSNSFAGMRYNLPDKLKAECKKFLQEYRPKHHKSYRKIYCRYDFSDGMNSADELQYYNYYMSGICHLIFYFDFKDYVDNLYKVALQQLKCTKDALHKNPKLILKRKPHFHEIPAIFRSFQWSGSPYFDRAMTNKIKNSQELIELAKSHPLKYIQAYGYLFELLRKTILNNYDKNKFIEDFKIYLAGDFFDYSHELKSFYRIQQREFCKIIDRQKIAFMAKHKSAEKILLTRLQYSENVTETARLIVDNAKLFNQSKSKLSKNDILLLATRLSRKIASDISNATLYRKALKILNYPYIITSLKSLSNFCVNAKQFNGKIYLLLHDSRSPNSSLAIFSYNPQFSFNPFKNKLSQLHRVDKIKIPNNSQLPFYAGRKYFIVGTRKKIIVIPRDGSLPSFIDDLPGNFIRGITMFNNRIFAFISNFDGENGIFLKDTVLFSCNSDGSERKIHISTLRRNKQNFFDRQKQFSPSNLFADEKNQRLLFSCSLPTGGLWEFNPITGKHKQHIKFRYSDTWVMQDKNKLFVGGFNSHQSSYYVFDINTNKVKFIFYIGNDTKNTKSKFIGNSRVFPPFFIKNAQMWFASDRVNFVALNKRIKIQDIYTPEIGTYNCFFSKFYSYPDERSVLLVTNKSIYKITPPK